MTDSVQTEVSMESRLSEMPALIQRLRSDPELLSRIRGREADFLIAMREALAKCRYSRQPGRCFEEGFRLLCLRG